MLAIYLRKVKQSMKQKPAHEIRRGLIKVRIWRKRTRSGVRHVVAVSRLASTGWIEADPPANRPLSLAPLERRRRHH